MSSDEAPFVVHPDDLPESEGRYPAPFDAEGLGFGRDLGGAAGTRTLGAWHDRLPPGRRTAFTHAHLREEEVIYVLSGTPVLRWVPPGGAAREEPLRPGSFVAFPAGTGIAHALSNPGPGDALLLVVGERRAGEQIAYPEDPVFEAWRQQTRPHRVWTEREGPSGEGRPPAWRIATARLELRPWVPEDAHALRALVEENQAHLLPWMPWAEALPSLDEQVRILEGFRAAYHRCEDHVLGIFRDGRAIGGTGLHPRVGPRACEIGYWIDRGHEGQGYVSEAVAALCRVAFEAHGVERVEVHCDPANVRSAAVPRRLGFTCEATLRRRTTGSGGRLRDAMIWSLFADELSASPAGATEVRAWDVLGRRLI